MDQYNTTNVHKYIDDHPHLMLLIRTEHDQLIGAYSEGCFKPKIISNHKGIIFALQAQRFFNNIRKSIIYD